MYLHHLLAKQELQQKAEAKVAGLEAQIAMLRDQITLLQVQYYLPMQICDVSYYARHQAHNSCTRI